jgi:hypothetical protein
MDAWQVDFPDFPQIMKTQHRFRLCAGLGIPLAWLTLVATLSARTAEDSFHFRNLSSEPPGEAVRQDLHPQLAVAGDLVHLAWVSQLPDQAGERLMYRRSTDGGVTFEPARILLSGNGSNFLVSGLSTQDSETGGYPAYLAADGQEVHLALLVTPPPGGPPQIVYLRSTDGGANFSAPQVWATVTLNPPEPGPGKGHTAALRPPMVAAAGGRVVVAFGYTAARAILTEFFGWQYGLYSELSVSWSANGGATFQPSVLHGVPPTTRGAAPSQIIIEGAEVLFAARDSSPIAWGGVETAVHAGYSTDGGANLHFRQLVPARESSFGDSVRMVKHGTQVAALFIAEDGSDSQLPTLYQCRSADGGDTWSDPQRLTEAPFEMLGTLELGSAGFSVANHGAEVLVAAACFSPGVTAGRVAVRRSTDGAATYSPWTTLADASDPRSSLLNPLHWPRLVQWAGAPGEMRAALLWGGNNLVTTHDSGTTFSPALKVRPPSQVVPLVGSPYAPHLVAGADGTVHLVVSSVTGTDSNEAEVYYRRIPAAGAPDAGNRALALGSNLPAPGDVSEPRHRDSLQVGAAPGLAAGEAFTIEFWVRYQGSAADRELFANGQGDFSLTTTSFGGTNRFQLQVLTDEGYQVATGTTVEPLAGRWYHLALRYDGARESGQLALLVDGQPDAVADAPGSRVATAHPFVFGNYFMGLGDSDFTGEIDDIRFWNAALPDETVRARRGIRLTGTEPDLAAWFPLDGNTRDATGNLPDGMLVCREAFVDGVPALGCAPVPSGLVSWWRAEGNFRDHAGANHAGGVAGAGFAPGKVGQAFDLDGGSAFIQVETPTGLPLGKAPRTILLWCKTARNLGSQPNTGIIQYGSNATGRMFGLVGSGNAPGKVYFFGYAKDLPGQTTLAPDTWHHLAVTYDGTTVTHYLNGQPDGSAALALDTALSADGLLIGNYPGSPKWLGSIDEVMIFNRALDATEIAAIHDAGDAGCCPGVGATDPPLPAAPSGLVSWWAAEDNFADRAGTNPALGVGEAGFTGGMVGRAFDLNGSTSLVQVAAPKSLPLGSAPRTLMLWCRSPRNLATSTESGILQYGSSSNGGMFGLITSGNAPGRMYFFGYHNDLAGVRTLTADTWHHLAVSYDGTVVRLYLDGQREAKAAIALGTILDGNGLTIGSRPGSSFWQGQLDEVMLFDRALEPWEIQVIHDAGPAGVPSTQEPPGAPEIPQVVVTRTANHLGLSWMPRAGVFYQPEISNTLAVDGWSDYGPPLSGNGEALRVELPLGPEPVKFIRIRIYR